MTEIEQESYAVGANVGASLANTGQKFDLKALYDGLTDVMQGKELKYSDEELTAFLTSFGQKVQEQEEALVRDMADKNLAKGNAYLEENGKKEGVTVTDSGLQYEVLSEGAGEKPTEDSTVRVHYAGTTIDGVEFDSSYKRGEPVEFPLDSVIPGWIEGVQLMNVGSKYRFTIPSELAYGVRGGGQVIGPNETLLFDVELLEIL